MNQPGDDQYQRQSPGEGESRAEASCRASGQAFTDLLLNSVEEGLCAFDAERRIVYCNPSAQRMLGWEERELLGQALHQTLQGAQPWDASGADIVTRVLHHGESVRRHHDRFLRRDGSAFPVAYTAAPIVEDDRVTGGVLAFHDITQLTRTQEQLQQLNRTLEQRVAKRTAQARARAEQLRVMATEMSQAEQRERRRLGKLLHDHIQQLLVAIKMQLGPLEALDGDGGGQAAADAQELLAEAIKTVRSLSAEIAPPVLYDFGFNAALEWLTRWAGERYRLRVELEVDEGAEIEDESLRVLVFDAVRELLINVVKHAEVEEASIIVVTGPERMHVTVEDGGKGFDPDQVQQNRTRTGHGLVSLEQRLALMGTRVQVDSEPGEGTRVHIIVPLGQARESASRYRPAAALAPQTTAPAPAASDRAGEEGARVLLIEDHEVVRQGLANLIEQQAAMHVIGQAATGEEAIELVRELQPDVVVMDIALPGISGIEATRQITKQHPQTRVIGLSMHEEHDVADDMRSAGAAGFVCKARPAEQLLAIIRNRATA